MQKYKNLVVLLVVLLIVIAGGTVLFKKYFDGNTHEKVKVSLVNLDKAKGNEKVPEDFPKDIPLQLTEVEDSVTLRYPDRGVIVSTITFKTFRSSEELFGFYKDYFESAGYEINEKATNIDNGVIFGTKEGDTLSVVISLTEDGSARRVQAVYTNNNVN